MIVVAWGLMIATTVASGIPVDLTELNGRTVSGQLISLTHEQVVIDTSAGQQSFSARQLLSVAPHTNNDGLTYRYRTTQVPSVAPNAN
ncbi:MAG TPA: hypothetical protein VFQ26_07435, partial [Nitrospiraceae bacterium]|nr:hypothetical protein [Nitrospiraceae bacterium]